MITGTVLKTEIRLLTLDMRCHMQVYYINVVVILKLFADR